MTPPITPGEAGDAVSLEALIKQWRKRAEGKWESGYYARNDAPNAIEQCADELERALAGRVPLAPAAEEPYPEAALWPYLRHHDDCTRKLMKGPCSCGLSQLFDQDVLAARVAPRGSRAEE